MKHKRNSKGSVLLEAALIMPVLLLLCFGLVQIALLISARQMTEYAAFCAARAALVHNQADAPGQAKQAACTVLSWIALSSRENGANRILPGLGIANGDIYDRTEVNLIYNNNVPSVTAELTFQSHLFVPGVSALLICFLGDAPRDDASADGFDVYNVRARCTLPVPYSINVFPNIAGD